MGGRRDATSAAQRGRVPRDGSGASDTELKIVKSLPEVPESIGGHFGVTDGMLNVFVTEIVL